MTSVARQRDSLQSTEVVKKEVQMFFISAQLYRKKERKKEIGSKPSILYPYLIKQIISHKNKTTLSLLLTFAYVVNYWCHPFIQWRSLLSPVSSCSFFFFLTCDKARESRRKGVPFILPFPRFADFLSEKRECLIAD